VNKIKWWAWLIIGLVTGAGLVLLITLLSRSKQGEDVSSPDTLDVVDVTEEGEIDIPERERGRAETTRDTTYKVKYILHWPDWAIAYLRHQDDVLNLVALRRQKGDDSTEVRSETYYAPDGFQVQVKGDNILVDTFPRSQVTIPMPPKKWRWLRLSGLGELDTRDGLGVGVEVSAWRIVRLQGLVGVGRICYEVGGQGWLANEYAPWIRLRFQIVIP